MRPPSGGFVVLWGHKQGIAMSLSHIGLALTLILWAVVTLGWLALDVKVIAVFALVTGILLFLEGASVWSYRTPTVVRRSN